jgi:glycerophosphoryl diester phosphodiesterase
MSKDFWGEPPIAIAHRGGDGAGAAKENTLEAFQSARDLGYEYVETDVIRAASGELVLVHGSHNFAQAAFKRDITRRTLQMMSLEQMRSIFKPGGAEVPLLEDALTAFPRMRFILDLKMDETVEPLARLIARLKVNNRICVTGFSYNRTLRFKKDIGSLPVTSGLTVGRGLRFRNFNMLMLKTGRLKDIEAVFLHHSLVSVPMLRIIHKHGLKAVVWTPNSKLGIRHAIRSGADGIIADRAALLKQIINAQK